MKHFLCTMDGPDSSYSCFEIHICWKVDREARIDPPIQTEYFLSGGAITLIFMVLGARAVISFCNAWVHSGASGQYCVGVKILTDVDVTLHDGVVGGLGNTNCFHTKEVGLEQSFRASESFVTNGNDLTIRKLVALFKGRRRCSCLHLIFEVKGNVAKLLLDVSDDFSLGGGRERVSSLSEDLHEEVSEITASEINTHDGVRQGVSLVDRHCVGDTVTGVQHNTCGSA